VFALLNCVSKGNPDPLIPDGSICFYFPEGQGGFRNLLKKELEYHLAAVATLQMKK